MSNNTHRHHNSNFDNNNETLLSYLLFSDHLGEMSSRQVLQHFDNLRNIFISGVQAVHPITLFNNSKNIKVHKSSENKEVLQIQDDCVELTGKKCHLIGFGKAVLGMAVQMERILGNHLVSGILSVPIGTKAKFANIPEMCLRKNSVIQIFEGAENNLPDNNAMETAKKIKNFTESMNKDDILFALVTGGGSALLPLPHPSITLEEKLNIIKRLVKMGASIDEVNIVRISLSLTKGGKIAEAGKNAHRLISFIIVDMVHCDPDLIGSGPSVPFLGRPITAKQILEKYNLWNNLSTVIQNCIGNNPIKSPPIPNNYFYILATNKIAVEGCFEKAKNLGYLPFILSTEIEGNVIDLADKYTKFLENLKKYISKEINKKCFHQNFPFSKNLIESFFETVRCSQETGKPLILILAGEPTVNIIGNGIGGRNQELALRMSLKLHENPLLRNIYFLSAGTDGIDGPTDVAGALGGHEICQQFFDVNGTLNECENMLKNNDSYNFYKNLHSGKFHIKTGHTGTNVMDIHLIVIPQN